MRPPPPQAQLVNVPQLPGSAPLVEVIEKGPTPPKDPVGLIHSGSTSHLVAPGVVPLPNPVPPIAVEEVRIPPQHICYITTRKGADLLLLLEVKPAHEGLPPTGVGRAQVSPGMVIQMIRLLRIEKEGQGRLHMMGLEPDINIDEPLPVVGVRIGVMGSVGLGHLRIRFLGLGR